MSEVVSKNPYELLGNDPDQDPDRAPDPPVQVKDPPVSRVGKRNDTGERPAKGNYGSGPRSGPELTEQGGNNRARQDTDGLRRDRHPDRTRDPMQHRDIGNRGRGSRGGKYGPAARGMQGTRTGRDDRHSRTGIVDSVNKTVQTGEKEFLDEAGGLDDARKEEEDGVIAEDTAPVNENGERLNESGDGPTTAETNQDGATELAEAEPEVKQMSLADFRAQEEERRAALNASRLEARKPNEGSSQSQPEGKAYVREERDLMERKESGTKKQKEKKQREMLDINQAWQEPEFTDSGRGEGRGGRARGGYRGTDDRGRGGYGREPGDFRGGGDSRGRGRGRGRGGFRGDRGADRGGERLSYRGGRGSPTVNVNDSTDFPKLG